MYALLSALSGLVLCVLVYGLSFVPSATLAQTDEASEAMNALQSATNRDSDAS